MADYECDIRIRSEEDGTYYAYAILLPGVFGRGDNIGHTIIDFKEAFAAIIESYHARGINIPWLEKPRDEDIVKPKGAIDVRVAVEYTDHLDSLCVNNVDQSTKD